MTASLAVTQRTKVGKSVRDLRSRGVLPGVLYGAKEQSTAVSFPLTAFTKVLKEAGESTVVTLTGLDEEKEVLIHEVAYDPLTGVPIHVDFYAIEKGKKVTVHVPIEFEGEAPVLKLGGTVTKVLHEIEIEAMPKDLPHELIVDVSTLVDFESVITVADVPVPEGVTVLSNAEDAVAVAAEAVEEPEEPVAAVDMEAIEVEEKGKKEEENQEEQ